MNALPFLRTISKSLLLGLAVLAVAGVATAQPVAAADRVLLLQAKRFEGSYKLSAGETSVKVGEATADWSASSGATKFEAALAPQAGKPSRATLSLDGRTVEGKATIEGKVLTLEFQDGKTAYRIKFTLSGRNEGEMSVTKNDATLLSGAFKRA